jgi:hypothetical protein
VSGRRAHGSLLWRSLPGPRDLVYVDPGRMREVYVMAMLQRIDCELSAFRGTVSLSNVL